MVTPREREKFKADFGYNACWNVWPDAAATDHHCHKASGHDGDCVCRCGVRCTPAMWREMGIPERQKSECGDTKQLPEMVVLADRIGRHVTDYAVCGEGQIFDLHPEDQMLVIKALRTATGNSD